MKIVLDTVTKVISKSKVLSEISMTLESPGIIGIRGINGSGKTMLLRAMAGLIYPSSGSVTIDGQVLGKDISFPSSVGVLIENPAFLNSYSGKENLKLLASIRGVLSDTEIDDVLEKVGLSLNADKKYRKYSLGMKQRLGIAAAIMEKPELILLDEPTNALDENGVSDLKQWIFEEKQRGALIVIASHDAVFLNEISDEVYYLNEGKLVTR